MSAPRGRTGRQASVAGAVTDRPSMRLGREETRRLSLLFALLFLAYLLMCHSHPRLPEFSAPPDSGSGDGSPSPRVQGGGADCPQSPHYRRDHDGPELALVTLPIELWLRPAGSSPQLSDYLGLGRGHSSDQVSLHSVKHAFEYVSAENVKDLGQPRPTWVGQPFQALRTITC